MNYALHNKELDGALYYKKRWNVGNEKSAPLIFTKAESGLLKGGKPFFIPDWSERVDYEAELVVRICRLGKGIPVRFAHRYYDAVTVGIDFTARDWQMRARDNGMPWDICKGFDGSAAIGEWVELELQDIHFHLDINGKTVQEGFSGDMLYSVDELIAYISMFFTLKTGDLLFTGTPAGVGPVHINDHLEGWLEDRKVLNMRCK